MISIEATCCVGDTISHFVAYHIGTGWITFLQTTNPGLIYASFEYVTCYSLNSYTRDFAKILKKLYCSEDYNANSYLTEMERKRKDCLIAIVST